MYTFSPQNLARDWQACKEAHTAAKEMAQLQSMLCPDCAAPYIEHLTSMARAFESVHGVKFDPSTPIERYEATEEARDFDAAVDARNSCMVGA
jgi:hypothetical protein